jgi:C4-dicarboxylate transporter, DctQ subunit
VLRRAGRLASALWDEVPMTMSGERREGPLLLRLADRGLGFVENYMNLAAAVAIFFLMLVGVGQIVARSVLGIAIYGYIDWIEQASPFFACLGIAYVQRLGNHIRMDLTMGWRPKIRWPIELFGCVVAIIIVTILVDATFQNFLRAYRLGDSTMDIRLPVWPAKLVVPVALGFLWLRLVIQIVGYTRMVIYPEAVPVGVPRLETFEVQVEAEIKEALGREQLDALEAQAREDARR